MSGAKPVRDPKIVLGAHKMARRLEIIQRHEAGVPLAEIARWAGVSRQAVSSLIRRWVCR